MAERETDQVARPFMGFAFAIEISVPGTVPRVCHAAFAECDGLERTMDVKTIRQGGDNGRQVRLTGPMGFGTLTLKRGMTANFDLWTWFDKLVESPGLVWAAVVVLYAAVGLLANLYVRYPLFLLPLVALGAGLLLSALWRRGRAGGWLVTLIMLAIALDALSFWYMRITFANK